MEHIQDYVIIGGGISGLYCLHKLCKHAVTQNKRFHITIIDDRTYFGGRLLTNKRPFYEIGGARFNDHHTKLIELLKEFNLHEDIVPLNEQVDFIELDTNTHTTRYYEDASSTFNDIMKNIIISSKRETKSYLKSMTLKQFIDKTSNSYLLSRKLINIFGYTTEFISMNAYDALQLFENDFVSKQFYVLKRGFSSLCDAIVKRYTSKQFNSHAVINYKLRNRVVNVKQSSENSTFLVSYTRVHPKDNIINRQNRPTKNIYTSNVVFAVKSEQLKPFKILSHIHPSLNCIGGAPLLRIYARYPKQAKYNNRVWFSDIPRITTNSILRHIIPIDPNTGVIMISYVDGMDMSPYYQDKTRQILKSDDAIQSMIKQELIKLFPDKSIPSPIYFKTHMWTVGTHYFKPKCDSNEIIRTVQIPKKGIYIIGEAFSKRQAWVEGALESVDRVF
jgi:monoamine oxidase